MQVFRSIEVVPENLNEIEFDDSFFKFCKFERIEPQSLISSDFVVCTFTNVEFYWNLIVQSNFIECKFENCDFMGARFSDVRFVDCVLARCRFTISNLGNDCEFSETVAYGCKLNETSGFAVEQR